MNKMQEFKKELTSLINRHSLENGSDSPDFILADYLTGCLHAFNECAEGRATAYHASMMDEIFRMSCDRRDAWNAPKPQSAPEPAPEQPVPHSAAPA